ncbi:MAG TPA: thioredoxin domain-containing protein [Myxococcota bacterium]|nr:thioredoxin domain-containing protein [Myxococcota bacterium]
MKKLIFAVFVLIFGLGCQKKNTELLDQIAKLEQRVAALEKRLSAAPQAQPKVDEQTEAYDIPAGGSFVMGNPSAPLTLTVFSDYQCPFCDKAHESFVEKVVEDPELKNKVKVVFKHFPLSFHKNARSASKAALAAGEQGPDCFWAMTKVLYTNQRDLSDENYKKWAKESVKCNQNGKVAALNAEKFWNDFTKNDEKYEKIIKDDMDLGMSKANVRGTPSFFLNGWKVGQRSVDAVKALIKEKNLAGG